MKDWFLIFIAAVVVAYLLVMLTLWLTLSCAELKELPMFRFGYAPMRCLGL